LGERTHLSHLPYSSPEHPANNFRIRSRAHRHRGREVRSPTHLRREFPLIARAARTALRHASLRSDRSAQPSRLLLICRRAATALGTFK